jgi:hypothetical protein
LLDELIAAPVMKFFLPLDWISCFLRGMTARWYSLSRAVGGACNEDVEVEGQWPQTAWLEARAVEQGVVLGFGAFAAAGVGQHVDVPLQREGRLAAGWYDTLDDKQDLVGGHGLAAAIQERLALLVIPVVQDAREHIDVASDRNGGEEVAGDDVAAIGEPVSAQPVVGRLDDVRALEDDAGQVWVGRANGGQQRAVAAANVDDGVRPP